MPLSVENCISGVDLTEPRLSPDAKWLAVVISNAQGAFVHLVDCLSQASKEVTPWPVRSGRSLGGGCYDWLPDGSGLVVVAKTGELWLISLSGSTTLLVIPPEGRQLFAPAVSADGTEVVFHLDQAEIHVVSIATGEIRRVDGGNFDFVCDPIWVRGEPLWQAWNIPHMAWDESALVCASGVVAGGQGIQFQQPASSTDDENFGWLDDKSGWLNFSAASGQRADEMYEHGSPTWSDRQRSWCFNSDATRIAFVRNENGFGRLCSMNLQTGVISEHAKAVHGQLSWVGNTLAALRTGGKTPTQIVIYDTSHEVWTRRTVMVGSSFEWTGHRSLVEPRLLRIEARDGVLLHARLYESTNPNGNLLCWIHGGPTDQWQVTFMPRLNYWIDRGYDILVPDFRGSTGHGRAYTQALRGAWGELDTHDVHDLLQAVKRDTNRLAHNVALLGSSAGGMTALCVAARYPGTVNCVIVSYPVSDIAALDETTHRFEAHYNRSLIGSAQETIVKSQMRSPIHHVVALAQTPLLVMHGQDDLVVSIEQSERLFQQVTSCGGIIELVRFQHEGHGFRDPATKADEFTRTQQFLQQHLR